MELRKAFITLVAAAAALPVAGQAVRKYSNEFLSHGAGARGMAMGNAVVASTGGVYSTYYNPSGLLAMGQEVEVGYMHSEYFAGMAQYDYGAVSYRISETQAAALSFVRSGVDNIPNTLELFADGVLNYDRVTAFSVADMAFVGSFATAMPVEGLTLGANLKVVRRKLGSFAKSWGAGVDLGARYQLGPWTFAAAFRDATGTYNAWRFNTASLADVFALTGNELPENSLEITTPRLVAAAAYGHTFMGKIDLVAEANLDITTDRKRNTLIRSNFVSVDPSLGVEVSYSKIVYARFGARNLQREPKIDDAHRQRFTVMPCIGAGVRVNRLAVDYAYCDLGDVSGALYSHVVSAKYYFNARGKS